MHYVCLITILVLPLILLGHINSPLILMFRHLGFTYSITLSCAGFIVEVHNVLKTHIIIRDLNKISAESKILKTP